MQWRGARHVVILLDTGVHAERARRVHRRQRDPTLGATTPPRLDRARHRRRAPRQIRTLPSLRRHRSAPSPAVGGQPTPPREAHQERP